MKLTYIILATVLLFSCKKQAEKHELTNNTSVKDTIIKDVLENEEIFNGITLDSTKLGLNFTPQGNYKNILGLIEQKRHHFKSQYTSAPQKTLDSVSSYFYDTLLNNIVPHWYGTTWAYEGHTNVPNNDEIACGYFVSTTLKHFGFNLNRYKMAQQAGLNEALSLQNKKELKIYRNIDYPKLKESLLKIYTDGIYFVGLSNHVGYVLVKNQELYFLHSSYCDNQVVIEYAEHSYCFESDIYVFAEISTNKSLLKKWIFNEHIPINQ